MPTKNPQLALNQYVIKWLDNGKSIYRDVALRAVLSKFGLKDIEAQKAAIRNSKFFRNEPISLYEYGSVWVLRNRNIVADMCINTTTTEVHTIDESLV